MKESIYKDIADIVNENKILKERINKAIEYIKENNRYSCIGGVIEFYGDFDELLNILKGNNK